MTISRLLVVLSVAALPGCWLRCGSDEVVDTQVAMLEQGKVLLYVVEREGRLPDPGESLAVPTIGVDFPSGQAPCSWRAGVPSGVEVFCPGADAILGTEDDPVLLLHSQTEVRWMRDVVPTRAESRGCNCD